MNAMQVSNVVRCLSSVVFLVMCITSALTEAASYQKTDGTIVDPILGRNYADRFLILHRTPGQIWSPVWTCTTQACAARTCGKQTCAARH